MSTRPLLSVIVPTRGRPRSLERTIRGLDAQRLDDSDLEIVVSLDGPDARAEALLASASSRFPVRWRFRSHQGRAAARNTGARLARGEILWFLDDDVVPSPDCARAHIAAHAAAPRRGVLGPVPIPPGGTPVAAYRSRGFEARHARLCRAGAAVRALDVYAGNVSVRRADFRAVGGFDPSFDTYGHEDFELALRLIRSGVEFVYAPRAAAVQFYEKSASQLARDVLAEGRSAVRFARRHPAAAADLPLHRFGRRHPAERRAIDALLRLDRHGGLVTAGVSGGLAALDRLGLAGKRAYDRAFDYLYWRGVDQALRDAGRGPLWERIRALWADASS